MRSLSLKLTLTFLAVSLVGVALVAAFIWGNTIREFDQFLLDRGQNEFVAAAATYYQTNGSWSGVLTALSADQQPFARAPQQAGDRPPPPPPFALLDASGVVVAGGGPFHLGDAIPADRQNGAVTITVDGQRVGTVLLTGNSPGRDTIGERYLARTTQALVLAALVAAAVAVLLGVFLARSVTRPIRDLTAAAHAMAEGRLGQQVQVRSRDEIGELSSTFNRMSADLDKANHLRRQMTADIAHDLRTPLAVITGYLESLRDGVLKPTPERYQTMFDEAKHLQRLVEDLRTLSLADAGELAMNRQPVQPSEMLERLAVAFQHQAEQQQVAIRLEVEPSLPDVHVDPERMEQVLGNLVSNSLRYTSEGGNIVLSARREGSGVALSVRDDGAGIAPEALPHIFERFYRGDESRKQQGEESGLGLAIARSIVELHKGRISAFSEGIGRGTMVSVVLPARA